MRGHINTPSPVIDNKVYPRRLDVPEPLYTEAPVAAPEPLLSEHTPDTVPGPPVPPCNDDDDHDIVKPRPQSPSPKSPIQGTGADTKILKLTRHQVDSKIKDVG